MSERISAYFLAADPTWIEHSVPAIYERVDRIVVSFDGSGRGYTGAAVPTEETLAKFRAFDTEGKCEFVGGDWCVGPDVDPMVGEVAQRHDAMARCEDADWILAIDQDEVIVDAADLDRIIEAAAPGTNAIDFPSRTMYRDLGRSWFAEIATVAYRPMVSELGGVLVRPDVVLSDGRKPAGGYVAPLVKVTPIVHNAWARDEAAIRRKVRTWSHSSPEMVDYVERVWMPARRRWPVMANFHPLVPKAWPRLRPVRARSLGIPGLG